MSVTVADQLSENVVGTFSLPYSLVPEVLVNGQEYTVPYVTEEPSVVAAASYASKIIKRAGGFTAQVHERQMIGQVALYQVVEPEQAQEKIASKKAELLSLPIKPILPLLNAGAERVIYMWNSSKAKQTFSLFISMSIPRKPWVLICSTPCWRP